MRFEKEQAFYEENRNELRSKYAGKRVVIVKTQPRGSFMVKFIPADPKKEVIRLSPLGNLVSP